MSEDKWRYNWLCIRTNSAAELELDEEGTRISLTIVDTPGFGDQIDNEEWWAWMSV